MTITELGPSTVEDARDARSARPLRVATPSILDTTEVRWFVPGSLPPHVHARFAGSTGVIEERCDTYLLGGHDQVGVKRRFGKTLELKVRQSLDGRIRLGAGLSGAIEVWRRWSPAEGLVDLDPEGEWVDVGKSIVKRRFSADGAEISFSSRTPVNGAGCDVEVAEVTVGATRAWTFALAGFGPPSTRRDSLLAAWRGLTVEGCGPATFAGRHALAMGYPAWLTRTVLSASTVDARPLAGLGVGIGR